MKQRLVIQDRALAAKLSTTRGAHYLAPYFERPCSISEAAEELGEPMSRMHYWTRQWHDLGLLEVVEERKRAGRPIALYRTVAKEFVIPDEVLPESLLERQLEGLNRVLLKSFTKQLSGGGSGMHIFREPGHRGVTMNHGDGLDRPDTWGGSSRHSSFRLALTRDEARELHDELVALQDRWIERAGRSDRRKGQAGTRDHLVLLASAPMDD